MEGLQLPTHWSEEEERAIRALMYNLREAETCFFLQRTGLWMFFEGEDRLWEVLTRIDQREYLKRPGRGKSGLGQALHGLAQLGLTLGMSAKYNLLILEARRRLGTQPRKSLPPHGVKGPY